MLSLQVPYRSTFTERFGTDYTEQGKLFEELTAESLSKLGWRIHSTAWSKGASSPIGDKVEALAAHLGEPSRPEAVDRWTDADAKDGGLDIVCHLPFVDGWSGRPLFYVQCASGEGWKDKRHTPVLALLDKLLDLTTRPRRGIAIPFALLADEFRKAANFDQLALFLDRHRVCAPISNLESKWVSPELHGKLNEWTKSRLDLLLPAHAA